MPHLRIAELCKAKNWTQTRTSQEVKVDHITNKRYWMGTYKLVNLDILKKYADALEVTICDLIVEEDAPLSKGE